MGCHGDKINVKKYRAFIINQSLLISSRACTCVATLRMILPYKVMVRMISETNGALISEMQRAVNPYWTVVRDSIRNWSSHHIQTKTATVE